MGRSRNRKKLQKKEEIQRPAQAPGFLINIEHLIFIISIGIWAIFWYRYTWGEITASIPYYNTAITSSLDKMHAMHATYDAASRDFYSILKQCDDILPKFEKLRIILNKANTNKYEFLREKGRYFLYPRNYGDNERQANYILVYDVDDFEVPEGYRIHTTFTSGKYLLVKEGTPPGK